jgi:DNA ligase-1
MLFSDLATRFRELEETSSRTQLIKILAGIFGAADCDEVGSIAYLLQGRLAPAFVALEMGMGVQNVAAAIGRAYDVEKAAVLARFDRLGDLGSVAGELAVGAESEQREGDSPDVGAVFRRLVEIARFAGTGSAAQKVSALAALLGAVDPLSATYICRVPLGTLRLGVGDLTILDAYSVAQCGDRSLRPRLERAYNETSDLGLIGQTLWTGDIEAVDALAVRVGNPVRPMLAERLPSAEAILDRLGTCSIENKYDGFRCQVHKDGDRVTIFSRSLEEMTDAFPELATGAIAQVRAGTAIFEGEALAHNPLTDEYLPFQETMRRRRKHGIEDAAASLPLRLFAFDVLYVDGQNVMPRPYTERREVLAELIAPGETILTSRAHAVDDQDTLLKLFDEAITEGLEGIMAKRLDSPYQAGARSYNWVKLKRAQAGHLRDTVDCVIVGYMYGRGRRAALGVGALLVAVYDPDRDVFPTITKIGTGLSDQDWRSVLDRCGPYVSEHRPARVESKLIPSVWVEPAVVVEILADEITRSPLYPAGARDGDPGYALRFPRLIRFREDDKKPEDATTVTEIFELYGQQGARTTPGRD